MYGACGLWRRVEFLTLHGFAQALPQLPAMFLKQPVPDVILADRTEERKTKNIPIIRGAFPAGTGPTIHKQKSNKKTETKGEEITNKCNK